MMVHVPGSFAFSHPTEMTISRLEPATNVWLNCNGIAAPFVDVTSVPTLVIAI